MFFDLRTSELVSVFIEKVAGQFSKTQIKKRNESETKR